MPVSATTKTSNIPLFTYKNAISQTVSFSGPYVLARSFIAVSWIVDGLILKQLGNDAILSGAIITTVRGCVKGVSGGVMLVTGFLAGKHITAADKLNSPSQQPEAALRYQVAGRLSRQTWIIAIPLSVVFSAAIWLVNSFSMSRVCFDINFASFMN